MIAVCAIRKVARELPHPIGLGTALVYMATLGDDVGDRDRIVLRRPRLASLYGSAKNMQRKCLVLDSIATEFRLEVLFLSEPLHDPAIAFAMDRHSNVRESIFRCQCSR